MKRKPFAFIMLLSPALCVSFAGTPSTCGPGAPARAAVYPYVYDRTADDTTNLFSSTSFRARNTRFLNELAGNMRALRERFADTAGKKHAVLSLWIGASGAVDSAAVECDTNAFGALRDSVRAKLVSWRFSHSGQRRLLVIQDITFSKTQANGFYQRNRKKVWIGGALLALLLFVL